MASKSKRRRRVFRASCILAALIIAGSSFAWFTSKDEVSNRLSANADYGVSIVESFAPPKNWLPGSNINKDVYDVNTGSIDAFVNNDVTGKLSYTYETLVSKFDAANGVQLNSEDVADTKIDGATTMEAGGFLAWTNTSELLGNKTSVRVEDEDVFGNRWVPTEEGIYIFRRSDNNGTTANGFTYSGYYFVPATTTEPAKYYKIVLGDDPYPAYDAGKDIQGNSNVPGLGTSFDVSVDQANMLGFGVTIDPDTGIITGTPTVRYAVESEVDNVDVNFVYNDGSTDGKGKRLVVEYAANTSVDGNGNTYDASATAARAEVEYQNALDVYNNKKARFDQIKADYDYAKALQEARDALVKAAEARGKINDDATSSSSANDSARAAVANEGTSLFNDHFDGEIVKTGTTNLPDAISAAGTTLINQTTKDEINDNTPATDDAKQNLADLGALEGTINTLLSDIKTQLNTLKNTNVTAADAAQAVDTLRQKVSQLKIKMQEYKEKYANIVDIANADHQHITNLDASTVATNKAAIQAVINEVTTLATEIDKVNGIADLSAEYTKKAATSAAANDSTAIANADQAWNEAKTAYNNAVGNTGDGAGAKYAAAIAAISVTSNGTAAADQYTETGKDNSVKLINENSAQRNVSTAPGDASIDQTGYDFATNYGDKDYNYYRALKPGATVAVPVTSGTNVTINGSTYLDKSTFTEVNFAAATKWNQGDDTADTYNALESAAIAARADKDAKEKVYNEAHRVLPDGKVVKINVYLAPDFDTYWTRDEKTDGTTTASFYLNHILEAGATSEKLIDSVELDSSVETGTYKNMTFDLNVALDSAQVTYDPKDQSKITADSVVTPEPFGMKATVTDQHTKAVQWDNLGT